MISAFFGGLQMFGKVNLFLKCRYNLFLLTIGLIRMLAFVTGVFDV
jgi:hypothetical protein